MICFLITTYNRKKGLDNLLMSIDNFVDNKVAIVLDDCSDYDVTDVTDQYDFVRLIRNKINQGKYYFWKTITTLYQESKDIDADYFISIQDDKFLLPYTVDEAVYYWNNIQDDKKIAMNIFTHLNRFGKSAKDVGITPVSALFENVLVLKNMWCDHHFICNKKFFEVIDYSIPEIPLLRWKKHPNKPSGVGGKTSKILVNKGYNIYMAPRNLIGLGNIENSKMNSKMNRPSYAKYRL